eukprot:TRINITY_DN4481_c0_g1_i1.p1 TRINITY_DN4481_c0_g1~~TRINITY_DN4481_c0_g1_i1.p1  ORF type:complete len:932 (-),score=92.35 TRINITY_DN4481_c0_g1_i1:13-2808(-)
MRPNAIEREPGLLTDVNNLYQWQMTHNTGPLWVTHDGPPYANGDLHIGHALNKVLKDIVNRFKMMQGHRVSFIPGWDCHGLPIELKALEKTKNSSHDPKLIRQIARQFALGEIEKQKREFMSWGILGDWNHPYRTMDYSYEAAQIGVFDTLYHKGFIYRGLRPVHWSPSTRTALADAELEYNDNHVSKSVYVAFPVSDVGRSGSGEKLKAYLTHGRTLSSVIWTTTPWSLPANQAVCVHPDVQYSIVKKQVDEDVYYIVAKDLLGELRKKTGLPLDAVLDGLKGADLVGVVCSHPFLGRPSPIMEGEHVTTSAGTGLVHTAPGHGQDDFAVGTKHNLNILSPVDDGGRFTAEAGERLAGKAVLADGNTEVIAMLNEAKALVFGEDITHRYPYDWRSKKPIIIRATKQWFVDLRPVQHHALKCLDDIQMVPPSGKARLGAMLVGRADWCISRQRVWGVPLPVFYDARGEPVVHSDISKHVQSLIEKHGSDCWWDMSVQDLLPPSFRNNGETYTKGTDTMDVWFDSGVSWKGVLLQRGIDIPADLYLEGSDQHRGWFQSSLLTAMGVESRAPFKSIVTHGFTLDESGQKMSKSLGNTISPSFIVRGGKDKRKDPPYGVDILRLVAASADYTKDISIGTNGFAKVHESVKKFRNTIRFALSNLYDFNPEVDMVKYEDMLEVDKFILHRLYNFVDDATHAYNNFNFSKVYRDLVSFASVELSSVYFDVIKHRLYVEAPANIRRRSSQTALHIIATALAKVIAPLAPHMAEDINNHIPFNLTLSAQQPQSSIFCAGWVKNPVQFNRPDLEAKWAVILEVRQAVNAALEIVRSKKAIGRSEEAHISIVIPGGNQSAHLGTLQSIGSELTDIFMVSSCDLRASTSSEGPSDIPLASHTTANFTVEVRLASKHKCPRCWRKNSERDDIPCSSCSSVIKT